MLKNALFLEKAGKIAQAPPQTLNLLFPLNLLLNIVKIKKITTYYLILEWQLMGPLAKLAPPPGSNL